MRSVRPKSLKLLQAVGWVEGISMILLVFVAMPLKYALDSPLAVRIVGTAHGFLWIAYLLVLAYAWFDRKWKFSTALWGGIASVLPFGPFVFERRVIARDAAN